MLEEAVKKSEDELILRRYEDIKKRMETTHNLATDKPREVYVPPCVSDQEYKSAKFQSEVQSYVDFFLFADGPHIKRKFPSQSVVQRRYFMTWNLFIGNEAYFVI